MKLGPVRHYDEKKYEIIDTLSTKTDAKRVAEHVRKRGNRARVVKTARGWCVFGRVGKKG